MKYNVLSRRAAGVASVALALFFVSIAPSASAALFQPGETLDPGCLPTDSNCGITEPDFYTQLHATTTDALAQGSVNKYYADTRVQTYLDTISPGYFLSRHFQPVDPAARTQQVITELSRIMMVPKDDQATMATITDAVGLAKQQAFFQNAKNGDVLVLFPSTQQAVLYRESQNIIVNVGPIQPPPATAQ